MFIALVWVAFHVATLTRSDIVLGGCLSLVIARN